MIKQFYFWQFNLAYHLFAQDTSIVIISTQLNDFNHCRFTQIILFDIYHLFAQMNWLQVLLFNANYSIQHYSLICAQ